MKIATIVWAIIKNLLAIAVVFGMFRVASSAFETVSVSGLTLIYISVSSTEVVSDNMLLELLARLARIARLLNDPEIKEFDDSLKSLADTQARLLIARFIDAFANLFIGCVAVWNLIAVAL